MVGCVCMKRVVCVYVHARGRGGGTIKIYLQCCFYFYMAAGVCWFLGFFFEGVGKPLELYLPWPREALRGHW